MLRIVLLSATPFCLGEYGAVKGRRIPCSKDREPIGLSEGMVLIRNKALVPYWLGFAIAPM